MSPALTLGLIAAACGSLAQRRQDVRATQAFRSIAAVAAMVVFLHAPRSFAEVTIWALGCACICLSAGASRREGLAGAGIGGLLIGASAPYVVATLDPVTAMPVAVVAAGLGLAALLAGAASGRQAGAAVAGLTTALALGWLAPPATGGALAVALVIAVRVARSFPRVSAALLLLLPLVGYGGALT